MSLGILICLVNRIIGLGLCVFSQALVSVVFLFFKGNDDFHLDVYKNGYPSGLKGPRDGRE